MDVDQDQKEELQIKGQADAEKNKVGRRTFTHCATSSLFADDRL